MTKSVEYVPDDHRARLQTELDIPKENSSIVALFYLPVAVVLSGCSLESLSATTMVSACSVVVLPAAELCYRHGDSIELESIYIGLIMRKYIFSVV